MGFTGQLGTKNSRLGSFILGSAGVGGLDQTIDDSLTFTEFIFGLGRLSVHDTLVFSEIPTTYRVLTVTASDTLTFTDAAYRNKTGDAADSVTLSDMMVCLRSVPASASSVITFAEAVSCHFLAVRTINESLTFTEQRTRTVIRHLVVSESVILTETILGVDTKVTNDTVIFSDTVSAILSHGVRDILDFDSLFSLNAIFLKTTADVFEIYEHVLLGLYLRLSVSSTLIFSDTASAFKTHLLADTVIFSESMTGVDSKSISDSIIWFDIGTVNKYKRVLAQDVLNFSELRPVNKTLLRTISDAIVFVDTVRTLRARYYSTSDTVTFTNTLYREIRLTSTTDTVTFSDIAACHKVGAITLADTVIFMNTMAVTTVLLLRTSDLLKWFESPPGQIQPNSIPDVPVGSYGTVFGKNTLFTGKEKSVVLPAPEFNDYIKDRSQVIFKRNMVGAVSTFIKTSEDQVLHYEFMITRPKADEFREFLDSEQGNTINIADPFGYVWLAKLLTDNVEKEEVARWEPFGNKTRVTVEFIGIRNA